MTPIIEIDGLSKAYVISHQPKAAYGTLRDDIVNILRRPFQPQITQGAARETVWALEDVSFDVNAGDIVGIVGGNGAGKSTLLKILSRIVEPTHGRATLRGRVGSLLEVGTGFHPELTGRENIFLNGAILGMKKQEIMRKIDAIVDFSEVERYLDTPVKFYSSGMYVRLAFAIAAHLEPDILIVDEVLSVGDAAFQKKSLGRMRDATQDEGRTVLFVSHNMAAIESLCTRAVFLQNGRLLNIGGTTGVVREYLSSLSAHVSENLAERTDRQGNGGLRFTSISLRSGENGQYLDTAQCGQDLEFVTGFTSDGQLANATVSMVVYAPSGQCLIDLESDMAGFRLGPIPKQGYISCRIKRLPLAPGEYFLNVYCESNGEIVDWVQNATTFDVEAGEFFGTGKLPPSTHGGLLVDQEWEVAGA
jgi:lipopolysaccharide transport system ATP-binding protein